MNKLITKAAAFAFVPLLAASYCKADHVHLELSCAGDRPSAQVTVKWGHDHYQNLSVAPIVAHRGQTVVVDFETPAGESEFEIQTEGGTGTGYVVNARIDGCKGVYVQHGGGEAINAINGTRVRRSSKENRYGEQNIKVDPR